MFKNKPVTLIIASGLMIVLVVLTAVFQFSGIGRGFGMDGARIGNFQPGSRPEGGAFPEGGELPSGRTMSENGNPPPGSENFQPGSEFSDRTNMQGFQGNNFSSTAINLKLMQLLNGLLIGFSVLVMILGILSVVGMLLAKNWGRVLAIITSILIALTTIVSLFQRMSGLTVAASLLKILLAIAIMVLCFLSKPRQEVVAD